MTTGGGGARPSPHMRRALALAERASGRTAPNPMVGCVVVDAAGRAIAEGWHRRAGLAHAEVDALGKLAPGAARGATAYVTLEPCNHHGRTGPCTEALIAAGVARVVAAMRDPHDIVDGRGVERLRAAGVVVELGDGEAEARALNAGYVAWVTTGRPRVTLKAAVSLDGRIATASGDARWVTGEAARREVHRLRDRAQAILVGAGTVRADDPELTTRLPAGRGHDPLRVVLDGRLTTPPTARVARAGTLFVAALDDAHRDRAPDGAAPGIDAREAALRATGAEVLRVARAASGGVDLGAALDELGRRGVHELLVEGGARVHGAFLAAHLVHRVILFVAPKIVGSDGVPLAALPSPARMPDVLALRDVSTRRVGDDMVLAGFLDGPPHPLMPANPSTTGARPEPR